MLDAIFGSVVLALIAGVAYAAAGVAIRVQWALLRGFDFFIAVSILWGAEVLIALTHRVSAPPYSLVLATGVTLGICALAGAVWNWSLASFFPVREMGGLLLLASLGFSLAMSGVVGWIRGPGLRQVVVLPSSSLLPNVPSSVSFALGIGAPLLASVFIWTRTKSGLALDLLAQNATFAREIGIERSTIAAQAGLVAGLLGGITGCYFALSSGSHPEIGLTGFLLGAGAAFVSTRRSITSALPGGILIASLQVGLQHVLAPAIATAIVFLVVLSLILTRGPDRVHESLR
jgi:branched-subunit amino acid ABC-type transport system permease component